MGKSSSTSCCILDSSNLLHPMHDNSLRHANSDPMLLEQEKTTQWNGMSSKRRSSSYDELDDHLTRSERIRTSPVFFIDPSEPGTSSLVAIRHKKNKKLTQPASIFYRLSPKSSPKLSQKHRHSPEVKKRHSSSSVHVALPKSSKSISKSVVQANNPALSKRKPRSATVDALVSSAEHEKNRVQLARYFKPGVLMLKDLNSRMCIIQKKLKEKEKDFCFTNEIK